MKAKIYTALAIMLLAAMPAGKMNAQQQDQNCLRNLSIFSTHYQNENYPLAMEYFRMLYEDCPAVSRNLYSRGVEMFRMFFQETGNIAYVDTVMHLYDMWHEHTPSDTKAGMDRRKVAFLTSTVNKQVNPELEVTFSERTYEILRPYFEETPELVLNDFIMIYTITSIELLNAGKIAREEVVDNYFRIQHVFDTRLKENPSDLHLIQTQSTNEGFFWSSGVFSCDNLIPTFRKQLEDSPDSPELMQKIITMLSEAQCTHEEFYFSTVEAYYAFERNAASAYELAEMHWVRENVDEAEKYYKESIELETNPARKSFILTKLMGIELRNENMVQLRDYGKKAIEYNPNNALALYLIGTAYYGAKIGDDDFLNRTVFWVAADYFQKALNVGLDAANEERAKTLLDNSRSAFPRSDDAFFERFYIDGTTELRPEGSAYTVGGWINERTTVRYRK